MESDCTGSCGKVAQPRTSIDEMACLVNIAPRPTDCTCCLSEADWYAKSCAPPLPVTSELLVIQAQSRDAPLLEYAQLRSSLPFRSLNEARRQAALVARSRWQQRSRGRRAHWGVGPKADATTNQCRSTHKVCSRRPGSGDVTPVRVPLHAQTAARRVAALPRALLPLRCWREAPPGSP